MIIHENKAIFIHIPKTAGTSVAHSLLTQILGYETTGNMLGLADELQERFCVHYLQKHKQACDYIPDDISKERWNTYYKFAFVRNPWDRIVSEFTWLAQRRKTHELLNFNNFIEYLEKCNAAKNMSLHTQTQWSFVSVNNQLVLNDIFRFEKIYEGIDSINKRLNINLNLKKFNATTHKPYREYYNAQTKKIIGKIYKKDIEMFGYEF